MTSSCWRFFHTVLCGRFYIKADFWCKHFQLFSIFQTPTNLSFSCRRFQIFHWFCGILLPNVGGITGIKFITLNIIFYSIDIMFVSLINMNRDNASNINIIFFPTWCFISEVIFGNLILTFKSKMLVNYCRQRLLLQNYMYIVVVFIHKC